ncbi:uncharacterized protein LOC112187538 isoform X1 [Rosa chinensis]|uniref:uncharacterized protein LOC112187538 isoform X1 n=1 Tax=Rosa chinensis TaxID=74649 RepID=UPI000D096C72|nr:uncharacterized protein LOC112187538 isoform X1 [Rosa chinensis]
MAEAAQNPVSQPEKVVITNRHGEKLVGLLHETGSKELVILCHGARSHKGDNIMTKLALALKKEGISAFCFDFAGNGESEGTFQFGQYWREVDDLHAVVQHFSGTNHTVSAILGHSKGGDEVLLYASKYGDVRTVVNVSGRYDLNGGLELRLGKNFMERIKKQGYLDIKDKTGTDKRAERGMDISSFSSYGIFSPQFLDIGFVAMLVGTFDCRVTEESLLDRMNTKMHESCLKIAKDCRVLTVHGSDDDVIPVGDALEFAKIIPNHKLHVIQGADHYYSDHQAELASTILEFLKAAFQEDKTTSN